MISPNEEFIAQGVGPRVGICVEALIARWSGMMLMLPGFPDRILFVSQALVCKDGVASVARSSQAGKVELQREPCSILASQTSCPQKERQGMVDFLLRLVCPLHARASSWQPVDSSSSGAYGSKAACTAVVASTPLQVDLARVGFMFMPLGRGFHIALEPKFANDRHILFPLHALEHREIKRGIWRCAHLPCDQQCYFPGCPF